jgi:hypothetical protein
MPSENSPFVTIEQAGIWIERRKWFDHNEATRIGFAQATLDDIIDRHLRGTIQFSAILDGSRCTLDALDVSDFVFEIIWLTRAGLFNAGSHGNCAVRGRSIQVFLPDKIVDLSCPSSELVRSAAVQAEVNGYHRVIQHIRVKRQQVIDNWSVKPIRNSSRPIVPSSRDDVIDALLLAVSDPNFPNNAVALFDMMRQAASALSSVSNTELERFISDECPDFWEFIKNHWNNIRDGKKEYSRKSKATDYIFKEHGRFFYKWNLIEDRLLISIREVGLPESHGALLVRVQDIVSSENGGPGRTENDRHFRRYKRFFQATAGEGTRAKANARGAKTVRTPANRRSL